MKAVVIASGPSRLPEDVDAIHTWRTAETSERRLVVAVNSSCFDAPWADIIFACDFAWWNLNIKRVREACPGTALWTSSKPAAERFKLNYIRRDSKQGLHPDPGAVNSGDNSGFQAISLAVKQGATSLVLVGFDFKFGPNGERHCHPDHPRPLTNATNIKGWMHHMPFLAADLEKAGIRTVNASRDTALECFDRVSLDAALAGSDTVVPAPLAVPSQSESQVAPLAPKIGTAGDALRPVFIRGMGGMGDCIHQRSVVKHFLSRGREVWLATPWPQLYWDLPQVHLFYHETALRTQSQNAQRLRGLYSAKAPPPNAEKVMVSYSPQDVRSCGSVLAAMSKQCGTPPGDFFLPMRPEWMVEAHRWLDQWRPTKPVLIYRPLVQRTEWGGCHIRNPDAKAYTELLNSIRDRYFVISVADVVPGKEWIVSPDIKADVECHQGNLPVETLAALISMSSLVFCSPGFAVILAQAVRTPVVAVFGGYENSSSFAEGARFSKYLGIDTVKPCSCFSHKHDCNKHIDMPRAIAQIREFTSDAANHSRRAA